MRVKRWATTSPVWYLENGDTELQRSTHDNKWHVRWILLERPFRLFGTEAAEFLAPVPTQRVIDETKATLRVLAEGFDAELDAPLAFYNTRFGQSFSVLSACRFLQTIQTGVVESKRVGAEWAKRELAPEWREFIDQAWAEREGVRFCVKIRQQASRELLIQTQRFIAYALSLVFA